MNRSLLLQLSSFACIVAASPTIYASPRQSANQQSLSIGMANSVSGKVILKRGRTGAPLALFDEVIEGDQILIPPAGRIKLVLYGSRQSATVSGAGTIKVTAAKIVLVSGGAKVEVVKAKPVVTGLVHTRAAIVKYMGSEATTRIISPNFGQASPPATVTWTPTPAPFRPTPEGMDPPVIVITVTQTATGRQASDRLPYNSVTWTLPEGFASEPGTYDIKLMTVGYGVGSKSVNGRFFVMPPAARQALPEAERATLGSNQAEDYIDLATAYRFWNMTADVERIYDLAAKKFPTNRDVATAIEEWKRAKEESK